MHPSLSIAPHSFAESPHADTSQTDIGQSAYRFVANIAAGDLDRALRAVKIAAPAGEIRLVLIACSELGLPLKGAALYVLSHLPDPGIFWNLFHSLAPGTQLENS